MLQARELDSAINAFTRSVQLNPENGESWNNLAALNMHKKKSKEAFVAFREALKFKCVLNSIGFHISHVLQEVWN
jgi:cytochrome c-type biogenesis protein CcmH/NrfG